eukprot:CAMPEP_0173379668 /NCGR_PEP_ID=MMETSP1356-20130122/2519_1 /TAXON_ID=77927 ORGANISM="Hemiselmis virescens, Strain PCC157" /NCGR_SAMPLE_ID=MMETSP1356 /ASSEMBLY_ACC=CAM_ASM_000847 /LENGTH=102 /DNA_ID=CAMNT_0014333039 /DNA_START=45 /DNA_END=350 /DNA_ORIENTATION=-
MPGATATPHAPSMEHRHTAAARPAGGLPSVSSGISSEFIFSWHRAFMQERAALGDLDYAEEPGGDDAPGGPQPAGDSMGGTAEDWALNQNRAQRVALRRRQM